MATKPPVFQTIGKSLIESAVELYRSLGFSMIIDLIWFVAYMPLIIVVNICLPQIHQTGDVISIATLLLGFFCIWNSLVSGPFVTTIFAFYQERKVDYPNFKGLVKLFKKFYVRSVNISGIFSIGISLLAMNIIMAIITKQILFLIAGIISLYILLFIMMMSFYFNPLIQLDNSFKKVLRKSFLLVSDNLGISFCIIIILGMILALCIQFSFLFILVYGPIFIYFSDRGFEAVYNQYEL